MGEVLVVNPASVGVMGVLGATKRSARTAIVRHDSWSEDGLLNLARSAGRHPSAAITLGHGRIGEDLSVVGLLAKPRLLGPIAVRLDRCPGLNEKLRRLVRDPVLDHAADWVLTLLAAAGGCEIHHTDSFKPHRVSHSPYDADELRPEGRAWLVATMVELIGEESLCAHEARRLWKFWRGGR
ncbi:MAG TPA: hypothetical protein ENJ00_08385 [Phycisphaerales bacterium]|nr:hypothetical protein [Phycisphaerales bacterium]